MLHGFQTLCPGMLRNTAAALLAVCTTVGAQELEPRAYSNSPIGLNFIIAGYGYAKGDILTDPSLPVDNAGIESHVGIFAFATTFKVLSQSGKFDLVIPCADLSAEGVVMGVLRERHIADFGDPAFRFSMNFFGAPALTAAEFSSYRQDLILGASLRIGVPLGQYDAERLVNIGSNRWSLKPEIGLSKAVGPWTFELAAGVTFYTDNDDFFGGSTREQDALFAVQGHLSYSIAPGCWVGLNGAWFSGGRSTLDGVQKNDRQEGARLGLTLAFPFTRRQSVKFYAATGFNNDWGRDFDAVGVAWQCRWGGGL